MRNSLLALPLILALSSCESLPDWLGSAEEPPLPGERFAVMEEDISLNPDITLDGEQIDIPDTTSESSNMASVGNYAFDGKFSSVNEVDAGEAPDESLYLSYPPLVADNRVYVIDGESNISAYDANSLEQKWQKKLKLPEEDEDLPGGGLTYAYGVLYATTGAGYVAALSADDGSIVWQKDLGVPLRRPPAVQEDKVFAATIDNQLFALSAIDGTTLWRHSGARETTSFYGSANPVVKNEVAVVAYSSGEVFGINTTRGAELWSELIALSTDRRSAGSNLNDVTAAPVIADGIVYIGGHSGELGAYNLAKGSPIWKQKTGSVDTTPWVAGRFIYAVVQGNKIVALNRFDGRVKWVGTLPKSDDDRKRNFWSGPVMAGGNLYVVSSHGMLVQVNPLNGGVTKKLEVSEGIFVAPVVANNRLYMLNREAKLIQVK